MPGRKTEKVIGLKIKKCFLYIIFYCKIKCLQKLTNRKQNRYMHTICRYHFMVCYFVPLKSICIHYNLDIFTHFCPKHPNNTSISPVLIVFIFYSHFLTKTESLWVNFAEFFSWSYLKDNIHQKNYPTI